MFCVYSGHFFLTAGNAKADNVLPTGPAMDAEPCRETGTSREHSGSLTGKTNAPRPLPPRRTPLKQIGPED